MQQYPGDSSLDSDGRDLSAMALWFCFAFGGLRRDLTECEGRDTQKVSPGGTPGYRPFRKAGLGKVQL